MLTHLEKRSIKNGWSNLGMFFEHFWEQFWGPILGPDRPKRGQDEPKRAIRSFKEPKSCISKSLKNHKFFSVFGSRGFPREPQEAREGSQETPKEIPKVVQNLVKKWSKSEPKYEQKKVESLRKNIALTGGFAGAFLRPWGSKNAYLKMP